MDKIEEFIMAELEKFGDIKNDNSSQFNFIDSGFIDSLSIMKFIITVEQEFNIQFTDEDLLSGNFKTISGLAKIISAKD